MKTPEEIKKGLEVCPSHNDCTGICPYEGTNMCIRFLMKEALAYIQQLESRLAQVERERDAAVNDCGRFPCQTCEERENGDLCPMCVVKGSYRSLHQWRGVCAENSKEENEQ